MLSASAQDQEDGDLGAQLSWSSSLDGKLGVGRVLAGRYRALVLKKPGGADEHALAQATVEMGASESREVVLRVDPRNRPKAPAKSRSKSGVVWNLYSSVAAA